MEIRNNAYYKWFFTSDLEAKLILSFYKLSYFYTLKHKINKNNSINPNHTNVENVVSSQLSQQMADEI